MVCFRISLVAAASLENVANQTKINKIKEKHQNHALTRNTHESNRKITFTKGNQVRITFYNVYISRPLTHFTKRWPTAKHTKNIRFFYVLCYSMYYIFVSNVKLHMHIEYVSVETVCSKTHSSSLLMPIFGWNIYFFVLVGHFYIVIFTFVDIIVASVRFSFFAVTVDFDWFIRIKPMKRHTSPDKPHKLTHLLENRQLVYAMWKKCFDLFFMWVLTFFFPAYQFMDVLLEYVMFAYTVDSIRWCSEVL